MSILLVHTTVGQYYYSGDDANLYDVTIPETTAGNCLLVAVMTNFAGGPGGVTGVTLGGEDDNFAQLLESDEYDPDNYDAYDVVIFWADPDCAGGQTALVVVTNDEIAGITDLDIVVLEISGLASASVLDKSSTNGATGVNGSTGYTSGTTGETTEAAEMWVGGVYESADYEFSLPSGYTDSGINAIDNQGACGYKIVSSEGEATYNAASVDWSDNGYAAAVITLKPAGGAAQTRTASLTVDPAFTADRLHGRYRTASLTPSPSFTADRLHGRYRTAALALAPSFTADRKQVHARAATLALEPSFTAARTQAHVRTASLTVDPSFTAEGMAHAGAQTRTASLTVTPSFTATGMVNRQAPPTVRYPYHHREAAR